jgi:hypothetical protein
MFDFFIIWSNSNEELQIEICYFKTYLRLLKREIPMNVFKRTHKLTVPIYILILICICSAICDEYIFLQIMQKYTPIIKQISETFVVQ